MNSRIKRKSSWLQQYPFHPFVFGIYPILTLLALNTSEVAVSAGYRSMLISFILTVLLVLVFQLIYRDWRRAASITTVALILFYSYGHIYILIKGINLSEIYLFRHRVLIPIWAGIGTFALWKMSRGSFNPETMTYLLNTMGLILCILPIYQLISSPFQGRLSQMDAEKEAQALELQVGSAPPDIYYIILDGYGREDVLKDRYGFDNSDFLNTLRNLGFYVADCSQSNYSQTRISLASSLNLNYIDALGDHFRAGTDDRAGLGALIKHSAVRKSLEAVGYKTVAFATGFIWTQLDDANYYLVPEPNRGDLNEFEYLLLETTFARVIQDNARHDEQAPGPELYRERTLFALDKLDKLSSIKGPKFVFAHLIIPHAPYVFGPTGGPVEAIAMGTTRSEEDSIAYRDQAIYVSSRMKEIVPRIIADSVVPPIIVIQADHGPSAHGDKPLRMKILNAYYLPGVDVPLYPTITPVNTFRVIFNIYFGQNLQLLDDVSRYSNRSPFNYTLISNACKKDR